MNTAGDRNTDLDRGLSNRGLPNQGLPTVPLKLTINGTDHDLQVVPWVTLLDLVRERLHLTGTKKGCNQGACGACTMLVDGERIVSCLALAVQYEGRSITTIEGLSRDGDMHPLQQAFIEHDGFQCGYCTPGQICSAVAMAQELARGAPSHVTGNITSDSIEPKRDELAERMSGNLCRCGAHNGIIDAIAATYGTGSQTYNAPEGSEVAA